MISVPVRRRLPRCVGPAVGRALAAFMFLSNCTGSHYYISLIMSLWPTGVRRPSDFGLGEVSALT